MAKDLENLFRNILNAQKNTVFFVATVVKIDGNICTVSYQNLEISGVRLQATEEGGTGVIITPKTNTKVLIGKIGEGFEDCFVAVADEAEKVLLEATDRVDIKVKEGATIGVSGTVDLKGKGGGEITVGDKIGIKNDAQNIKGILKEIVDAIMPKDAMAGNVKVQSVGIVKKKNSIKKNIDALFLDKI